MADNVKVGIEVSDNGTTNKVTKNVKDLKGILDQTAESASRTSKAIQGATAATTPSGRVARSAAARPTGMAGETAGISGREVEEYNRALGATGRAGGGARDFADQARGLGGLVRLYATVAANAFAAAAAFGALSRAMDTTNMVKGLDQLGAASGSNLGTLSKNLALASDGAISLRDAMEATAKASSAGLSNKQILDMGEAAKKASQALGVSMPDALSRISRGISKLEPELLDELGIYVKIDDAVTNYARSLGKTAGSLTDFERRQAFANAVLDQARQKFGNIEIDSNPYSKLLASFQNLIQSGLELVNKVLGPIVKLLAESPIALASLITVIGVSLVGRALPALTEWREGLRKSAEASAQAAKQIADNFGDTFQAKLEKAFRLPALEKSIKDTEQKLSKLKVQPVAGMVVPKSLESVETAKITEYSEAGIKGLNKLITTRQQYVDTGLKGQKQLTDAGIANYKTELEYLTKKRDNLISNQKIVELETKLEKDRQAAKIAGEKALSVADKPVGKLDPETIAFKNYQKLEKAAVKYNAVAEAADTARVAGVKLAWTDLNKTIEEKGIKGFSKWSILAQGGLAAVGSRLLGLIGVFGQVGMVIAGAVAIFEVLDSALGKNSKEASAAAEGFKKLNESAKFVDSVLSDLSKKDPLAKISVEAINARATAFNELATGLEDQFTKITRQVETANWWDKFIDGFKTAIGTDLLSTSAKEFSFSISQAFKLSTEGLGKSKAIQEFKTAFNIDPTDRAALESTLKESPEKFITLAPQLVAKMKELGIEISNVASRGKELNTAFDTAEKTLKDFVTSSLPTDPVAKFGTQLIDVSIKLGEALKNPETRLAAIADIAKSIGKQSLLGNIGIDIAKNSKDILDAASKIAIFNEALENLSKRREELIQKAPTTAFGLSPKERAEVSYIDMAMKAIKESSVEYTKILDDAGKKLATAQENAFNRGVKYMEASIASSFAKAAIAVSTAFASRLGDTEAGILRRAELEKQTNNLQIAQLQSQKDMLTAQSSLENAIRTLTVSVEKDTISRKELAKQPLTAAEEKRKVEIAAEEKAKLEGLPTQTTQQQKMLDLARRNIDAQIAQILASNKAIDVRTQDQLAEKRIKVANDVLSVENSILNTRKQIFDVETKSQPYLTGEQLTRKKILDDQLLQNKQIEEYSNIQKEIDKNLRTLTDKGTSVADRTAAVKALQELGQESIRVTQKQTQERIRAEESYYQFIFENEKNRLEFIADQENKINQLKQDALNISTDNAAKISEIELQSAEQAQKFTEQYLSNLRYESDVTKITEEGKRKEYDITNQYRIKQEELFRQIARELEISGGEGTVKSAALAAEMSALAEKNRQEVSGIKAVTSAELEKASAIKKSKDQQDSYNKSLEAIKDIESVFKSIGSAVSGLVAALYSAEKAQKQYNNTRIDLEAKISKEKDEFKNLKLTQQLADLNEQRTRDELSANAKVIGSTKLLFKEKTLAYKTLATLEKTLYIARLAMDAKQIVSGLASTAATVTQSTVRAFAYGKEAIASAFAAPFPINFATGAAMTAIIASLLGKAFGGRGAVQPQGFTAEEQQKVQGTGQTYRGGELVTREGGVLGDPTARAESVTKSLELVSKNTFEGLQYSDKMLEALKSIDQNTKGLTLAMLRSFSPSARGGITQGIPTGELRGNVSLGTAGTVGGMVAGGFAGAAAGAALQWAVMGSAVSSVLGPAVLAAFGPIGIGLGILLGGTINKVVGKVFGGKVTQTIEDFGITVNGALGEITSGTTGLVKEYANLKKVKEGGWFRSDKTSFETLAQDASEGIQQAVGRLFVGVKDSLISAGELLGTDVKDSVSNFIVEGFKISTKDLKPEEIAKAIEGEVSIVFNQIAQSAFGDLIKEFGKPFEEAGETVIRLAKQTQVFSLAMTSIGKSVEGIAQNIKIGIADSLIEAAGGIEKFIEQTKFFADNFLTESERLAPVQKAVTEELGKLNLGFVDTREEFRDIVKALDLTIPAQRDLYTSLMNLAPAFAQVYKEAKALTEEELKSKIYDQEMTMLKLLGRDQKILTRTREKELAELAKYPKAQADILIANQNYIYALEDEQKAKDKIIKQNDKLKNTVATLTSAIENLDNYRQNLLTGENSILTPLQRYQESQSEFLRLQALATGPAATEEARKAQQDAISKLPTAADKFLQLSRTLFASGSQYTEDFSSVVSAVDASQAILQTQKTDAEIQIGLIRDTVGSLDSIEENTLTTVELLDEYLKLQTAANEALGLTTLKSNQTIPEPVTNTNLIQQLIETNAKLAKLQTELEGLRTEQRAQTGEIITSNAQVTNNNAETVATAVDDIFNGREWRSRSTPTIER